MLQSENEMLKTESDRMREEVRILEENLDNSIMREEQGLTDEMPKGSDEMDSLKHMLKEQRLKYEVRPLQRVGSERKTEHCLFL